MRVLISGGDGLLAHSIKQIAPTDMDLVCCDSKEFDLTNCDGMARRLAELKPELVINTAAYNLVDRCEQMRELSWEVNAKGPEALADLCSVIRAQLIHFSSDYVFDGAKNAPYSEADQPNPLNHYGAGKLYGETAVLKASPRNLVLRTSWLFGPHPRQGKSFIHTVLRQARSGSALKATTDQVAAPTYAPDLARWTIALARKRVAGLFHAVNDGGLSRYEWALSILAAATGLGLISIAPKVEPVLTAHFGTVMRRPVYTVLDNAKAGLALGQALGSWRLGLDETLQTLRS